jgi:C4-type Zn-finger protein
MARRNPMHVKCPECGGSHLRASRWRTPWERFIDLLGFSTMRCTDCGHRWTQSLWRIHEMIYARCPKCYRLELTNWEETYYKIPSSWRVMAGMGAKKVRCKACRYNFLSFRFVKGKRKWVNVDPSEDPVPDETPISLTKLEDVSSEKPTRQ